ncbi:MAG: phage tail protein [Thermosynechococcaceae cyanobacterium MS004]|nr:phage tail protein [Thermosynechococcaceae cyanobacterium MS004]
MAPIAILAPIGINLAVGLGAGLLINLLSPAQKVEGQRLNDLTAPKSQWGAQIPQVWGSMRLAGNVIWADDIREVVTKKRQGGKGLGPKVQSTEYSYFASMAALLCRGEIIGIRRLWLNSKLVVNLGVDADAQTLANSLKFMADYVRVYRGTETQMPDPLIQGKVGIEDTPAYRGLAYLVLDNLPLADYGNAFPAISAEVVQAGQVMTSGAIAPAAVPLASVIQEICEQVGFQPAELDLDELDEQVKHFWVNTASPAAEHLSVLRRAFFFDAIDAGGKKLRFVKQQRPGSVQTVPLDRLGCYEAGQTPPDYFNEVRTQEFELPRMVSVSFPDPNVEYREGVQMSAVKGGTASQNEESLSLLVGMSASQAKTIADKQLFLAWARRRKFTFSGCLQQALLEPSDLISAPFRGTESLCCLTQVRLGANFLVEMQGLAYDAEIFDHQAFVKQPYSEAWTAVHNQAHQLKHPPILEWVELTNDDGSQVYARGTSYTLVEATGVVTILNSGIENNSVVRANYYAEESVGSAIIGSPGGTDLRILDIPLINDEDKEYGIYLAATGGEFWRNAALYASRTFVNGVALGHEPIAPILTKSIIGNCLTTLGAAEPYTIDYANTLDVEVPYGDLESFSIDQVLTGANTALVGEEVLRFCNAELIAPETYRLSTFVRGARGTEWAIASHQPNEQFVLLSGYLNEVEGKVTDIGGTVSFKALTTGQAIEEVDPVSMAIVPVRLRPYAPVILFAERDGGTVNLAWSRRDRKGGESQIFAIKPLSEDVERYLIEVWSAGLLERAVTVNGAQSLALAAVPSPVIIKIHQVSTKVGNGYSAEVTV